MYSQTRKSHRPTEKSNDQFDLTFYFLSPCRIFTEKTLSAQCLSQLFLVANFDLEVQGSTNVVNVLRMVLRHTFGAQINE